MLPSARPFWLSRGESKRSEASYVFPQLREMVIYDCLIDEDVKYERHGGRADHSDHDSGDLPFTPSK